MSIFIKTGYWEKAYKGLKGWLDLDRLIKDIIALYPGSNISQDETDAIQGADNPSASNPFTTSDEVASNYLKLDQTVQQTITESFKTDGIDLVLDTDIADIKGRIRWDDGEETLVFGVDGGTIDVNKELFDYYVDSSTGGLAEGDVVSVVGISGNRQAVDLTDCTLRTSATACIGMVTYINHKVRVTKNGRVRDIDTRDYTEGLPVYVDPLNPGKLTQTSPSSPNYFIHVGIVEVSANKGIIDVDIRVVYTLDDLSDVKIETPLARQIVRRDPTNNFWQNETWDLSITRGDYRYDAQSETEDTVGDWRTYSDDLGYYTQYCTVGNAIKGAGTWVTKFTIES